jgi:hypothetical protein
MMVFRYSCSRRRALAALASVTSLSGCVTTNQSAESRTTASRANTTKTAGTTSPDSPCEPQSTGGDVTWYSVGEWHTVTSGTKQGWLLTASNVELTRSFHHEKAGETYRMPDDEQLAVVTSKIGNPTSEMDTWAHGEELVGISHWHGLEANIVSRSPQRPVPRGELRAG